MAREETFLRRIAGAGTRGSGRYQPSTAEDLESLMTSVRDHLAVLLNARHGMSEALPDYGLPSLVDMTAEAGDHLKTLQDAIQNTIEKYEPRLRRVRVSCVREENETGGRTPVFRIDAVLVGKTGEHRVWYETQVRGSGEFDVHG